jgi:DNA replication and repair protein RecF
MIDGEPDIRREYFHQLMFHVKPGTKKLYLQYHKALKQRNRCLKNNLSKPELSTWSKELADLGLELSLEQYSFFQTFKEQNIKHIEEVVGTGEFTFLDNLNITFSKGWERSKKLLESLEESLEKDKAIGYTSKGPHRMDLTFQINNKKASSNLSRGQLKILILLLFLSNSSLIHKLTQAETLLMIDDLSSELDTNNLSSLLSRIVQSENQIVLTGIEGEEMHKSIEKLTNFTQINL